ncbi:NEP1-interacting protein 2-like [Actinidia eriantha]|uniref:NEP1-interacting protein 2-like n=1 Tax=Actinidia eriantha TaxID=165200 RepID=UPI00258EA07A|nr:NEP1-interacting protein 2-like [Actinidia eriantha]
MGRGWFSRIGNMVLWCKDAVSLCFFVKMGSSESDFLFTSVKKAVLAVLTCSLALGAACVGTVVGAIKGQTTESGFLRGAAIGAGAGAIAAVHLMELMVNGDTFSKVALLWSLMNGKFMEWLTTVVLKAYQWEMSNLGESISDYSEVWEINGSKGLSQEFIKKLPHYKFGSCHKLRPSQETSCVICLEEFNRGDMTRVLPSCAHSFHLQCIDEWLARHGSCPICRKDV